MGLGVCGRKLGYLGSRGIQNLCFLLLFLDHYFRSSLRLIIHRLANEPQLAESCFLVLGIRLRKTRSGDNQPQTQCQKV